MSKKLPHFLCLVFLAFFSPGRSIAKEPAFVANYDESKILPFELPDPLMDQEGNQVRAAEQWPARREELRDLFVQHVFGRMPNERRIKTRVLRRDPAWNEGRSVRYELAVEILPLKEQDSESGGLAIAVLVDVPAKASASKPVAAFLGLNFKGNHTTTDDPNVRLTSSWVKDERNEKSNKHAAAEAGRGMSSHRWPSEMINDRDYALVTVHYGDIDPDFDDGFQNGIHGLFADWIDQLPASERPGSIAGWTYGLQAVLDAIEQTPELGIDASRVAVIGHSRLGKTSLWAGAVDPRFAMVISNNSGCGGAALSRRAIGETVGRINRSFPHWFCDKFNSYSENENAMPVDNHELIALAAPRPVAVGSATKDTWADPKGEFLSAKYASPVYQLLGKTGLVDSIGNLPEVLPEADQAYSSGTISYHLREGKHDLTEHDWKRYLSFADEQL